MDDTLCCISGATHQRNGSAHVPAGTPQAFRILNAIREIHGAAPEIRIKELACLKHGIHFTASLRATATAARLKPIPSRSLRPHLRRLLSAELRVRMTTAASYSC